MIILACDLARQTGWAHGEAGEIPASGTWILDEPSQPLERLPSRLIDRLSTMVAERGRPDLIAAEMYMSPAWSRNDRATISQLFLWGALLAWCDASQIKLVWEQAATIRLQICGRGRGKDEGVKEMTLRTSKLLGFIPSDCKDDNRADATLVWAWAAANYAGRRAMVLA